MGGRKGIVEQGVIGGGYRPLAEVRIADELTRRVMVAAEAGEDPDLARERIQDEMVLEGLVEAFGAKVVKVDAGDLGEEVVSD